MGKKTRIRNILKIISGDNDEELMKFIKEKNLIRVKKLKKYYFYIFKIVFKWQVNYIIKFHINILLNIVKFF